MNKTDPKRREGFTLVELLVVMAIIAILMGIVLGIAGGVQSGAAEAKARAEIADLQLELEKYKEDKGVYPPEEDTPEGDNSLGTTFFGWYETRYPGTAYTTTEKLGNHPVDPWGRTYFYEYNPSVSPFVYLLGSRGQDGKEGTADDITNRD